MATQKLEEKLSLQEKVRLETEQLKKRQTELFKLTRENASKLENVGVELKHLEKDAVEQMKQIDKAMGALKMHEARIQKREELKTKILNILYEDVKRR